MKDNLIIFITLVFSISFNPNSFSFETNTNKNINNSKIENNEQIPIFLSADNNYAPYVATLMASVSKNTKSFINFYILSDGILDYNKKKIKNTNKFFNNFSVTFVEMNSEFLQSLFKLRGDLPGISRASYSRLLIPGLEVSKKLEKVIYMDIDMVVLKDIKELYNENLNEYIFAEVPDDILGNRRIRSRKNTKHLIFDPKHNYFNSGLLVIDCKKWREFDVSNKLIKIANLYTKNKYFIQQDQDTLNKYFNHNNYKALDWKYNLNSFETGKCLEKMKICNGYDLNGVSNRTVIIHFTGFKP